MLHDAVRLHFVQKTPGIESVMQGSNTTTSLLCKGDQLLLAGMDQTPGSKDESLVAESQRLGEEVDVERRVQLLISFTTQVVFGYIAQVCRSLLIPTQACLHAGLPCLDGSHRLLTLQTIS